MPRWSLVLVVLGLAVALGSATNRASPQPNAAPTATGPVSGVLPQTPPPEDPFPIRRLRATEAMLPELLKQLGPEPLVRMPRAEFEARVERAARELAEARIIPRLTSIQLTASLVEGDLVGTARLGVVNPASEPRWLPLDPLRIALSRASWGPDREAIVGGPMGSAGVAVRVDRPGEQTLELHWSATGITEPGERRFELRLPATPSATLLLELPSDQVPTPTASEVLLTGPFPIPGDPGRWLWQFHFGGRGRLDFAVRSASNPKVSAAASLVARYDLLPGQVACLFEYDLRPAKGTVREWTFALDPELQVSDVVVNNRAAWTIESTGWFNLSRQLRVTLRQPGTGGKVLISAVAPVPVPMPTTGLPLPMIRPLTGHLLAESLEVRMAPGLKLVEWKPGDYRLTDSQLLPDQTRMLSLVGTLTPAGVVQRFRRPPVLRTALAEADFTTTEQIAWRFESGRIDAVVRMSIRVRRGPVFQFGVTSPAGYSLTRVQSTPDDLIGYSELTAGAVLVEFARPLVTGQTTELVFEFRGPPLAADSLTVPFPRFTPQGATERVGVLAVFHRSDWQLDARPGAGCIRASWLDVLEPFPPAGAQAVFRYRGSDPDGSLTLMPMSQLPPKPPQATESVPPRSSMATPASGLRGWEFEGLYLISTVQSLTDARVVFGGLAASRGDRYLPVQLPAGASLQVALVEGRVVEPGKCVVDPEGVLQVPLPDSGLARFELHYRLPMKPVGPAWIVRSQEPTLPGESASARRWWIFAPEVLPGWPVLPWERGTTADLPTLLDELPLLTTGVGIVCQSTVEEVRVGSTRLAHVVGIVLTVAVIVLSWIGGQKQHPLVGVVSIGGLLLAGILFLLGPPWWQRAMTLPLFIGVLAVAAMVVIRGRRLVPVGLVLLVLGGLVSVTSTIAQPLAPALVVILSDKEGRETIITSKAVLDRLESSTYSAQPGVVLTAADYRIEVNDSSARVTTNLTVHALDVGQSLVTLPLAEGRLERVTLNGQPAFPTAPRPGVYSIPLPGQGRFTIEARFTVPITGTGAERELRFGVPECPLTRVTTDLPGTVSQVQTVGRLGQRITMPGERVRTVSDFGAIKTIQVRWREGLETTAAAVKIREGCVWDVSESGTELTACYLVRIEQGTISSLQVHLPRNVELLGVLVRPLEQGGTVGLRDWEIGPDPDEHGFWPLRLDFQGPTTGRLLVVLTGHSRLAPTQQPVLQFPRVATGTMAELDAVYGLRTRGVTVEELPRSWVIDFTADALTRDFAAVSELRLDPTTPLRVFRPVVGGVPELRPTLRSAPELPAMTVNTTWRVSPNRAVAVGTLGWSAAAAPALVEFSLPGVRVLEIRATDLLGWSQTADRVQVWRRKQAREGELEWIGTLDRSAPGATPPMTFDGVIPKLFDAKVLSQTVQVQAAAGWTLRLARDQGWPPGDSNELTFRTTNAELPPIRVLLSPAPLIGNIDGYGWFSPRRSKPPEMPLLPPADPAVKFSKPVVAPPAAVPPLWVWPLSTAIVWGIGMIGLAVLFIRFPAATWPEQFALVGGLCAAALLGHWIVAFLAWGGVRLVWWFERKVRAGPNRVAT